MNYLPLLLALLTADPLGPGDHARTLKVGDLDRKYLLHVPKQYDSKTPMPVVLAFHGGGANAEGMVKFCGLHDKADEAGFIVVYPSGTGRLEKLLTFNGGNCCGYAMQNNVDDVGFVRSLLDDLATVANIDSKRVFATGMSNGGIISYRLASELSDRIAAIAHRANQDETWQPGRSAFFKFLTKFHDLRSESFDLGTHLLYYLRQMFPDMGFLHFRSQSLLRFLNISFHFLGILHEFVGGIVKVGHFEVVGCGPKVMNASDDGFEFLGLGLKFRAMFGSPGMVCVDRVEFTLRSDDLLSHFGHFFVRRFRLSQFPLLGEQAL